VALAIHSRVAWQLLDGEAVLIDLERGLALGLNASASFLWLRLEGRTPAELAGELAAAYALTPEQAQRDVDGFIELLRARGYVSG
jgi:hypothetical protein